MTPASLVLDLVERVWNAGDVDALGDYYAETFEHDGATWAGTTYAILDCVGTDDAVALRWRATSTHVGPWGPVPTTGRRVEWIGAHFFNIEDGRIVAVHSLADQFGKAMQLGVHMTPPNIPQDKR